MQCMLGTNSHERESLAPVRHRLKKKKKNCLQQLHNCAHAPGRVNMEESEMFVVPAKVSRRWSVSLSGG